MRWLVTLSLLIAAAAVVLAALAWREQARLRDELALLRARPLPTTTPPAAAAIDMEALARELLPSLRRELVPPAGEEAAGAASSAEGPRAQLLQQSLADFEQLALRVDDLATQVTANHATTESFREQILAGRLPSGETLQELMERELAERKLKDEQAKSGGGKHHFDDLVAALALDGAQAEQARQAIDDGKRKAYDVLVIPRQDGGNFMDDLAKVFMEHGEQGGQAAAQGIYMQLFKEPLPGTTDTYGSAIMAMQAETAGTLRGLMRDEQSTTFDAMGLDLMEVDTGYDPFAEHVMKQMGVPGR